MTKDEILVVRMHPFRSSQDEMQLLRMHILAQLNTGVIVLPSYCDVVIAPSDAKIKVEEGK